MPDQTPQRYTGNPLQGQLDELRDLAGRPNLGYDNILNRALFRMGTLGLLGMRSAPAAQALGSPIPAAEPAAAPSATVTRLPVGRPTFRELQEQRYQNEGVPSPQGSRNFQDFWDKMRAHEGVDAAKARELERAYPDEPSAIEGYVNDPEKEAWQSDNPEPWRWGMKVPRTRYELEHDLPDRGITPVGPAANFNPPTVPRGDPYTQAYFDRLWGQWNDKAWAPTINEFKPNDPRYPQSYSPKQRAAVDSAQHIMDEPFPQYYSPPSEADGGAILRHYYGGHHG